MLSRILVWLGIGKNRLQRQTTAAQPDAPQPLAYRPSEPPPEPTANRQPGPPAEIPELGPLVTARAPGAPPASPAIRAADVRDIELVIGIDFGTSCTKIVARLPYEAGEPAYALPVPSERRAESDPHLWLSELWLAPDGTFALFPTAGANRLADLKWNLMQWPTLTAEPGPKPSPIEAAAAFLALHVRRTRIWLAEKRPDLLTSRYRLHWSWHIGFPAASLNDHASRKRYEICLAAALDLASGTVPLAFASVREAVIRAAEAAEARINEAGCAIFPEVAAAVAGFAHSPRHENGLYAMIDVGAATLDCCTFNLFRDRGGLVRGPVFVAAVALLGVEPWRRCNGNPSATSEFQHQLDWYPRAVIWKTRASRYKSSSRWEQGLPLFLIGGGRASSPHRECAESLTPWLRRHLGTDKYPHAAIPIFELPDPMLLDYEGDEQGVQRLAVAVGLSLPPDQIPEIKLPGPFPDEPAPSVRDVTSSHVGKEQV